MRRTVTMLALLTAVAGFGVAAPAVETTPARTTEPQATELKDSRKPVDNIIRVETVEDYWWHVYNFDPSVHYDVAPWLYDSLNLSRDSGDSGKD